LSDFLIVYTKFILDVLRLNFNSFERGNLSE